MQDNNRDHKSFTILVLNPGSTSTKISVFEDEAEVFTKTAQHTYEETLPTQPVLNQRPFRMNTVRAMLTEAGYDLAAFTAIVGRGGMIRPVESGTFAINQAMLDDLAAPSTYGHASSLGTFLAYDLGREYNKPAYIVDPVVLDEFEPVARVTGLPGFARHSRFHGLNHKAIGRQCAADLGLTYQEANLVVAHLGGGITVGAHRQGRIVDVSSGLMGDGPFTPERCGSLPAADVVRACFSGKFTEEEMIRFTTKAGGLIAHLGTNDLREAERRIAAGDEHCALIIDAMIYQVAKEIGAMATVLCGQVDAIALTGGLIKSERLVSDLCARIKSIAPIRLYPGEREMEALAQGVLRVLRGEEQIKRYYE